MNKLKYIQTLGRKAKKASEELSNINDKKKNAVLKTFYSEIKNNTKQILNANKIDIINSKKNKLKDNWVNDGINYTDQEKQLTIKILNHASLLSNSQS